MPARTSSDDNVSKGDNRQEGQEGTGEAQQGGEEETGEYGE